MSKEIKRRPELTDEFLIQRYNEIYKEDMIWFILGSLISSENFWDFDAEITDEKFKELCDNYEYNILKLDTIARIIVSCNEIPVSDQDKIRKYAMDGAEMLKQEYDAVKKKYNKLMNK
jgi:hypothetical protein